MAKKGTKKKGRKRAVKSPPATKAPNSSSSGKFVASIFPGQEEPLPGEFVDAVVDLQNHANMPIILLVQNQESQFGELGPVVWGHIFAERHNLEKGRHIGLLLNSPGGYARESYRIARFLIRHCGGFTVFVPFYAKSAATMLALGADRVVMGRHAELGPIDAQAISPDEGRRKSVLDEVQTLERLNAFALRSLDEAMQLLLRRTGMRVDKLLPQAMGFVDNLVRPLMENIDTIRWTELSRVLKVGEDYTIRLLRRKYPDQQAEQIARALSAKYTEHGFAIDIEELRDLAMREVHNPLKQPLVEEADQALDAIYERLMPFTNTLTAIGLLGEQEE